MVTTIRTSSKNYFNKIQKYLTNKRLFFTPSLNDGVYALTIFDLTTIESNSIIQKTTIPEEIYKVAQGKNSCLPPFAYTQTIVRQYADNRTTMRNLKPTPGRACSYISV